MDHRHDGRSAPPRRSGRDSPAAGPPGRGGSTWITRAVLDVGARADADQVHVAAQHAIVPDARFRPHLDVADQLRAGRDEGQPDRSAASCPRSSAPSVQPFPPLDPIDDHRRLRPFRPLIVEIGPPRHAEPLHQPPARLVADHGERDDVRRVERLEGEIERRRGRLLGIALPPGILAQPPADLMIAARPGCPRRRRA